ncbi:MAG TPA: prepilin-type N-terminal cleavage/methylation domain-containing protein [Tepidisphaeraceae bacterium]|jgi:general secretion pathway protein G|nr:prepilin-type N-terminal cleavage/methylation domain-containing protein [Tepidisphaeraceae bacterium]
MRTTQPPTRSQFLTGAPRSGKRSAFTLIEILIVVIILGIIAAIVVPQFSNASHQARENTMRDCLRYLRTQVTVFKAQHRDIPPGFPSGAPLSTPDAATFLSQMTNYSDELCNTSPTSSDVFHFGTYLSSMPANPLTGATGVLVVNTSTMPVPDQSQPFGWIYNTQTLDLIGNVEGNDSNGVPYSTY